MTTDRDSRDNGARKEFELPLADALRIKRAELWLEVQQPERAAVELCQLTNRGYMDEWAAEVVLAAAGSPDAQRGSARANVRSLV